MPYDPEHHGPRRIVGPGFHERVWDAVQRVPEGRVVTYGDIAAHLGLRSVARKVGHALAALPTDRAEVPWHRVVNARGHISRPTNTGSGREQRRRLMSEGIAVGRDGGIVEFSTMRFSFDD